MLILSETVHFEMYLDIYACMHTHTVGSVMWTMICTYTHSLWQSNSPSLNLDLNRSILEGLGQIGESQES